MATKENNVVLNFKMSGQVEYAKTIREINAIMNTAAKEYKNHIAAMGEDAKVTDKLAAEKKKLEVQMEAARKRTEMLRAQYEAMSKDTKTTTAQLTQMYGKLLDAERAEMALQKSLDRVNAELSEQGQSVREAKDELNRLGNEMGLLEAEQKKLISSFELQKAQLADNADEALRVSLAQKQVQQQMELTGQVVNNLEKQLDQAKKAYGENSKEVIQLETKLNGAKVELEKFTRELARIDDVSKEAEKGLNNLSSELAGLTGGLIAGGGIAGIVSQALDTSSLNTKIDISFNVPEESKATIKQAIRDIEAYGLDAEEAIEGVRRQWALNADATDEANRKIVEGAAAISKAYNGIDFIELIQEVNEVAGALEISNEEALALTNALLKAGFPPEQLDTIAEYGQQMKDIGFDAKEIQAIFEAGIDTKTWNIDNLNDGVKEARILMAEFGLEVDKSMKELLSQAGMSADKFQAWGKAVAEGGSEGSKAMAEMVTWLDGIEDAALRNEIAVKVFGTKWEDQGENLIAVFKGLADAQDKSKQNMDDFNATVERLNADPAVKMRNAMNDIKTASEPLLGLFADIISTVAGWISENPKLTATLVAIVSAIGILTGAAMALAPIITALATSGVSLSAVFAALTGPIGLTITAITALVTAIIAAYTQSETLREKVNEVFSAIQSIIETVIGTVTDYLQEKLETIKQFWAENGEQIQQAVENVFNAIKAVIEFVMPFVKALIEDTWNAIKNVIDGALNIIMGLIKTFSSLLTGDFKGMWEGIKQMFSGAVEAIWGIVQLGFLGKIFKVIQGFGGKAVDVITDMVSKFKGNFDDILSSAKSKFDAVYNAIMTPINKAKDLVKEALDKIYGFFRDLKLPEIKIPKIKLPHFKIKGDFSLSPPSVPTFSVDWYAKGGIFTRPTIFSTPTGFKGVGEAGPEAVLPLNNETLGAIGQGIAATLQMPETIVVQSVLDGKVIAESVTRLQYNDASMRARMRGVSI